MKTKKETASNLFISTNDKWLKIRNKCLQNVQCIEKVYLERIKLYQSTVLHDVQKAETETRDLQNNKRVVENFQNIANMTQRVVCNYNSEISNVRSGPSSESYGVIGK